MAQVLAVQLEKNTLRSRLAQRQAQERFPWSPRTLGEEVFSMMKGGTMNKAGSPSVVCMDLEASPNTAPLLSEGTSITRKGNKNHGGLWG